jgi:hypothetical protein
MSCRGVGYFTSRSVLGRRADDVVDNGPMAWSGATVGVDQARSLVGDSFPIYREPISDLLLEVS